MTLSVVIPTYNCADRLSECLRSVQWADEIIVVDMRSTDETRKVAHNFRAKVIERIPDNGNFDLNRKFGMEIANGDWILKLDSDEVLSTVLQEEIKEFLRSKDDQQFNGFNFYNRLFWFGKQITHGVAKPKSHELRLIRNDKWHYTPYRYHQQITVKGKVGFFKSFYDHFNYDSVTEFLEKTNKYTDLDAKVEASQHRISPLRILLFPFGSFIKLFFYQKGFLDGEVGLISCSLFALYNLTEKVKIWERQTVKVDSESKQPKHPETFPSQMVV